MSEIAVWFPTVKCGTGTDVFTINLAKALTEQGIRTEITWLPLRAEYAPWTVSTPKPPEWATIVHINTWLHPKFIPKNLPVIATIHHSIHDEALTPYKGWLRATYHRYWIRHIERATMKRANTVVAVSQFSAQSARQHILNRPIQVIYNGIDTKKFCPPECRSPHTPFRLLYVGGWKSLKGVDLLAPIMRELGNDYILHYTGGAAADKDKPNMPKNMIDIGRLNEEQVINAMQEADALLLPSRSEGFGLVAAEAMACGLPVIATQNSSLIEIVSSGNTGILCEKSDISEFTKAIPQLKKTEFTYKDCSQKARITAQNNFSYETMLAAYLQLYKMLSTRVNS